MKYALQLDNTYKLGYFSYMYNINYLVKLRFTGNVGGDIDIYKAIPKLTGIPVVLIGEGYIIVSVELEKEGEIYGCAVLNNAENQ